MGPTSCPDLNKSAIKVDKARLGRRRAERPRDGDAVGEEVEGGDQARQRLRHPLQWTGRLNFGRFVCLFCILFVFVVISQEPRFTNSLKSMILLFEDIFGPGFWPNVIFAVSRFSMASKHQVG